MRFYAPRSWICFGKLRRSWRVEVRWLMMQNIGRYPNEVRSQAEKQITVQSVVKVGQNLMLTVHAKGMETN